LLDLEVNGIQANYGINLLQRPILPLLDHGHDFVGNIGDEGSGNVYAIQVLEMILDRFFNCIKAYRF